MTPATQSDPWKAKEQMEEARYAREKEQAQRAALRTTQRESKSSAIPHDFEGGFGGQEDLEDRYSTTSGEH